MKELLVNNTITQNSVSVEKLLQHHKFNLIYNGLLIKHQK